MLSLAFLKALSDGCYGPSATSVSVTKAGLAGTDRRNGRGRTMGRGLSESRGSSSVREYVGLGNVPTYSVQYVST